MNRATCWLGSTSKQASPTWPGSKCPCSSNCDREKGGERPVDPKKFDREDQEFVQADSDSNGQLTPSEFEGFVNTRVKGFARHDEFFQGLDGNADGFLDRQEFSRRFELLGKLQRQ